MSTSSYNHSSGAAAGVEALAVAIADLRFNWSGATDQTLAIERFGLRTGERVLLRGPSGCGKSTLLAAMSGVVDVPAGTVRIAGTDVGALPQSHRDAFRVDHIGLIFQSFNLIPWLSVRDNVVLPCRFSAQRRQRLSGTPQDDAQKLLVALGIAEHSDTPAGNLSYGQQQRVAAARALIGTPDLILADEPTSALDPEAKDRFLSLLSREAAHSGAALLVVSHDPGLEHHFDRVIQMSEINAPKVDPC
ncbi:ATP-binding cassette domain-containing protein [Shimia haliotis]|uniref:Putative ABC transport system ATP-binding protein n=1 Tax=Shimia haliotis TaxID=1280847 RepID=A0A1I4A7S3_9RHOB|nr:ATP-binding cassette domain-containing protein [Shimia haliotis]SFK52147.1 putative ABC transport system ATP-binding protein [Shimia haliotis]